jgi:hypothetical protein
MFVDYLESWDAQRAEINAAVPESLQENVQVVRDIVRETRLLTTMQERARPCGCAALRLMADRVNHYVQ